MIEFLRTPSECFENITDYPFDENYLDDVIADPRIRMHYIDEGPSDANKVFLCLHGEPTWSYLYRKMIPIFVKSGARVIAPDWIGFGKSDKPIDDKTYTFNFHRDSLIKLIEKLDLKNITLVCQDWGGLLGLTIPMDMPDRFSRMIIMNTTLATGTFSLGQGFEKWKAFNHKHHDLNIAALMKKTCPSLYDEEAQAYAAPFPNADYKAGVRTFPELVCEKPDQEGAELARNAKDFFKTKWQGETFMAIGMQDTVIPPTSMQGLHKIIRGSYTPLQIEEAGHFVQEHGEIVARKALEAFETNS
jgi:haloalkane dehalogenase